MLGGRNTLKAKDVRAKAAMPDSLKEWWAEASARNEEAAVLEDLGTGSIVAHAGGDGETYGPVFVPYHDFRVLYAHSESPR